MNQAADFPQEHQGEGAFILGREMPNGWTLTIEFESWIGSDDDVLRTLASDGRTAVSAYRDPDTKTATIAHDSAILGRLTLAGGYFDGPSGSVDTTPSRHRVPHRGRLRRLRRLRTCRRS